MKYVITTVLLALGLFAQAQIEKTIHQTFVLEDEIQNVTLDIFDEYETEVWAGNTIMAVTRVELHSGAQHILDFYVKEGRYEMEVQGKDKSIKLVSKDKERRGIKYKDLTVFEQVKLKLYIPENFQISGKKLTRIVDETAAANQ